jgi:enterobactin synthetase component D
MSVNRGRAADGRAPVADTVHAWLAAPFPLADCIAQQTRRLRAAGTAAVVPALMQQQQFDTGRQCAAALLRAAGSSELGVARGADGAPCWPPGFVGSISHTAEFVAVALAPLAACGALGIDMEALLPPATAAEIRTLCFREPELTLAAWGRLDDAARISAGFCAKEALYKCLYPVSRRYFDFLEAEIVAVDLAAGNLTLRLLCDLAPQWRRGARFAVRFRFEAGHVFAAAILAPH